MKKPKWEQVYDAHGKRSRGLWKRGERYYVQTTVTDPQSGLKGVRRILLINCNTEPQARKAAEAMKIKAEQGEVFRKQGSPWLRDYIPHYIANAHKSEDTLRNEKCYLEKWSEWLGDIRLSNITPANILAYRTEALQPDAEGKCLSKRTVNVRVNALKSLLRMAKLECKIQKLPTEGIKELRHAYKTKPLLSVQQVEEIIGKAESLCPRSGKQFSDFVKLCAYSGGRMKEVLSLRWDKISFDKRLVEFFGKGSKTRHVDFNPKLEAHLRDMLSRKSDSPWLFPSQRIKGARITSFKKTLEKVRNDTGIDFSNHSFRHYFASMCVMAGIDFGVVGSWLGHADGGALAAKVYGHLNNQHKIDAAKKLTNI